MGVNWLFKLRKESFVSAFKWLSEQFCEIYFFFSHIVTNMIDTDDL